MEEKISVTNLISPSWFKDVTKSSIWIEGYRMMQVTRKDFLFFQSQPIIDLGDVRVLFSYGTLRYMDVSKVIEFGTNHVRNINESQFKPVETNIGGWTILITPYKWDGEQRTEEETRNSIIVAKAILSVMNSPNIVYEKVYENIVELSPFKLSASPPPFLTTFLPPNLQSPAL